jgi:hypothetical protein
MNKNTPPRKKTSKVWKSVTKFKKTIDVGDDKLIEYDFWKCNVDSCSHESKFNGTTQIRNHLASHNINFNSSSDDEKEDDERQDDYCKVSDKFEKSKRKDFKMQTYFC